MGNSNPCEGSTGINAGQALLQGIQRPCQTLMMAMLLGWLLTTASLAMSNERLSVLVIGDSLSAAYNIDSEQGWVALLEERLDGVASVINASISGETSRGGAQRLPELLRQHQPDLVLIELGGNDGLRGLPPQQLEANLSRMIEQSQDAGSRPLLIGIDIPPNYGSAYREAFQAVYQDLADQYQLPLVPSLLQDVALDQTLMQDDGIHPTAAAQPIMLDNVWRLLKPVLEAKTEQEMEVTAQ